MNIGYALGLGLVAGLANLLGALIITTRRTWPEKTLDRFLALSAGFLLAVAFIELGPEAMEAGPRMSLLILAGFLALHFVEKLFLNQHVHSHGVEGHHGELYDEDCEPRRAKHAFGLAALSGMLLHTLFDGISIGAGLQVSLATGFLIFVAVLLHKLPDGLVVASLMLASGQSRARAAWAGALLGAGTLVGAIVTSLLATAGNVGEAAETGIAQALLAFSTGIFLYVAASDLIPEINRQEDRSLAFWLLVGILVFYGADLILEGLLPV